MLSPDILANAVLATGGFMAARTPREIPPHTNLPDGTRTVVKVQRPPQDRGDHLRWMVFAHGLRHVRLYLAGQLPEFVTRDLVEDRKGYFLGEVKNGEWVLSKRVPDEDW
jgi:hypothetical protein